jgi:hypothetical protein
MRTSIDDLVNVGISYDDAVSLRRISMTLHRWFELECGDGNNFASWSIVRGKKTGKLFEYDDDGKPYIERHIHTADKPTYSLIADRETGAKKRLKRIMAGYPALTAYIQSDPRGCALYIGENLTDSDYSRGVAVYK